MSDAPYFLSIASFCRHFGFSRSTFVRLAKKGQGPRTGRLGDKIGISRDDAEAWAKNVVEAGEQP